LRKKQEKVSLSLSLWLFFFFNLKRTPTPTDPHERRTAPAQTEENQFAAQLKGPFSFARKKWAPIESRPMLNLLMARE
jgi:hypothetical protein